MKTRLLLGQHPTLTLTLLFSVALGSAAACSSGGSPTGAAGHGGAGGGSGPGPGAGVGGNLFGDAGVMDQNDFTAPVLDAGAPNDAPTLFGAPDTGKDGPCLYEPELGSLFPNNWLRPRFRWTAMPGQNLYELKLTIPHEKSPLVVYTPNTTWTMDNATWKIITSIGVGGPIHVTIRGAAYQNGMFTSGPTLGSAGDVEVAPVAAPGSVVYWTTSNGTVLKGFSIGDETVKDVLKPAQVTTSCVACHASTPDGKAVGFSARDNPQAGGDTDRTDIRSLDGKTALPAFVTPDGKALLDRPGQEGALYSKAHWMPGDRVEVVLYRQNAQWELSWIDLEANSQAQGTGWGIFARNGDPGHVALSSFSHDGTRIAYCSASMVDAAVFVTDGDIYTVDYGARQGGAASKVQGASDPNLNEFYPVFSPDDKLIAYNRVPLGHTNYNNPESEVFVIPTAGGQPTRLAANDPPACINRPSPGVTNSWPRWAPDKTTVDGTDYYFLIFSSTRNLTSMGPQLYVTPVVVSGGTIKTYAALYLWNQPEGENNHTPAWDSFDLSQVPK